MMTCTCIKDHAIALRKEFGPDTHLTNVRNMMDFETHEVWREMEPLRFSYHKKKADGSYEKKVSTSWVNNNYCALCGKKKVDSKKRKKK